MADIEVSIDAEAVERHVTEAILKSSLGAHIEKAVNDSLRRGSYGTGSAVENAVSAEVQQGVRLRVRELLRDDAEIRGRIEVAVAEALTAERIAEIVKGLVDSLGRVTDKDLGI